MKKDIKDTLEILVIIAITCAFVFSINKSFSNTLNKAQDRKSEIRNIQNIKNDTISTFYIKTR